MQKLDAVFKNKNIKFSVDTSDKNFKAQADYIINCITGNVSYKELVNLRSWLTMFTVNTSGDGTCKIIENKQNF